MKKVKIMLMSALVVAAVGGALAFKAQTVTMGLYCGTTLNYCPNPSTDCITTIGADINHQLFDLYCSTIQNGDCTYVTFCE